ncbi:hypothetical protein INR49_002420 [Caranx melampygus]|nr:hypothetical protein INR49_002420 [Caranx melampygus]
MKLDFYNLCKINKFFNDMLKVYQEGGVALMAVNLTKYTVFSRISPLPPRSPSKERISLSPSFFLTPEERSNPTVSLDLPVEVQKQHIAYKDITDKLKTTGLPNLSSRGSEVGALRGATQRRGVERMEERVLVGSPVILEQSLAVLSRWFLFWRLMEWNQQQQQQQLAAVVLDEDVS